MSVCYELNIPESLRNQGIQFIDILMMQSQGNQGVSGDRLKVSPPGYLHQNTDVGTRQWESGEDAFFELDYQIDNVLKVGDEDCHPDPAYDRDECVTQQLLDNSIKMFGCIPPGLGNYGLTTCTDASQYSMRQINNLIDCLKPCTKYSMRLRSDFSFRGRVKTYTVHNLYT